MKVSEGNRHLRRAAAALLISGIGLVGLGATHASAYGSTDGDLAITNSYHGQASAPFIATYTWQGNGACTNNQQAAFYWDYQFQHSTMYFMGVHPFVMQGSACVASVTATPPAGDSDFGAHDVTVWNTTFGPSIDTWKYYQVDNPPTPLPTPTAAPTATPTPTPPAPTHNPVPVVPGGSDQSNSGGAVLADTSLTNATPSPAPLADAVTTATTVPSGGVSTVGLAIAIVLLAVAAGIAGVMIARRRHAAE